MRTLLSTACAVVLMTAAASAQVGTKDRIQYFEHGLYGKGALAGTFAGAVLGEIRNSPSEYGRTTGGFAKRWGSRLGENAVKQSISFGVSAWHHEDLRYHRSDINGFTGRFLYAVKRTVIVPHSDRESSTLALGRIAGDFGAGLISRTWQPPSVSPISHGFQSGAVSLAFEAGKNVLREFWPRRK